MKQQRGCVSAVFSILTIAWMITVTHLEHDQIRVNIEPKSKHLIFPSGGWADVGLTMS
jgi:hypothetical protein